MAALAASLLGLPAAAQEAPAPAPPLWVRAAGACGVTPQAAFVSRCWPVTVDYRFLADDALSTWMIPDAPDGSSGMRVTGARELAGTSSGRVWRGELEGDPYGTAVFVRGQKTVIGRVTHADGRVYRLRTVDGLSVLEQINVAAIPDGLPPRVVTLARERAVAPRRAACEGSAQAVRVYIAVTDRAAKALGGDDYRQWLDLFVSDSNHAFAASGAKARIALAGSGLSAYSEIDLGVDITALEAGAGKELSTVADERRKAGADLLLLLTHYDGMPAGTGLANGFRLEHPSEFAPRAVAVVTAHGASAWFSFTHELGHLFGTGHDRPPGSKACLGAYCSSHGHVQPGAKDPRGPWMTVTAGRSGCDRCARRLAFSHPGSDQYGDPWGNPDSEDNAGTISETAPAIAQLHCYLPE
ncbi:MAG: hypothetical protein J0M16_08975 [Gammaproteobacteria bacterium]|nr:hypothetical protein [Gammaproteobacteria bacterium]